MEKVSFKKLKRQHPGEAKEFVDEQEALVVFLNSPDRASWMKAIGLPPASVEKINAIVEYYARCKVKAENKLKAKTKKQITHIEDECLKKVFEGHVMSINLKKAKAMEAAAKILKAEYKTSVILDDKQLAKLSKKEGLNKRFPEDFWVFNPDKKKVIGINILFE